jgi:hypothetical protein
MDSRLLGNEREGLPRRDAARNDGGRNGARNDIVLDKYIVTGCEGAYTWGVIGD